MVGRIVATVFLVLVMAGAPVEAQVEKSIFWATEGVGDGASSGYTQDDLTEWQRMCWAQDPTTEGVALDYLNGLEVTSPGALTLRVPSGGGEVYGFPYRNTGNVDHTLVNPAIGPTGWRVVLRTDWAARTVRSALLQSADGVAAIPAVTQTAGTTWEISLAQGTVAIGGVVTITQDDRTPLGSGGRWTVNPSDIANRSRTLFIPVEQFDLRTLTDGAGSFRYGFFTVPTDYASDMKAKAVVYCPTASGNIYDEMQVEHGAIGGDYDTFTPAVPAAAEALVQNKLTEVAELSLPDVEVGHVVYLWFTRNGADVLDTVNADVIFDGFTVSYTADS